MNASLILPERLAILFKTSKNILPPNRVLLRLPFCA
jgi:hypothetical protein